jgi:hypothetical protein
MIHNSADHQYYFPPEVLEAIEAKVDVAWHFFNMNPYYFIIKDSTKFEELYSRYLGSNKLLALHDCDVIQLYEFTYLNALRIEGIELKNTI